MTTPKTHTKKHHGPRGVQRKIVERANTARWLRKVVCTYDDSMDSYFTFSIGVAAELTKQDYDPSAMPSPPQGRHRWGARTKAMWTGMLTWDVSTM